MKLRSSEATALTRGEVNYNESKVLGIYSGDVGGRTGSKGSTVWGSGVRTGRSPSKGSKGKFGRRNDRDLGEGKTREDQLRGTECNVGKERVRMSLDRMMSANTGATI